MKTLRIALCIIGGACLLSACATNNNKDKTVGTEPTSEEETLSIQREGVLHDPLGNVIFVNEQEELSPYGFPGTRTRIERITPLKSEDFLGIAGYDGVQNAGGKWIADVVGEPDGFYIGTFLDTTDAKIPYYILEDGTAAACHYKDRKNFTDLERIFILDSEGTIIKKLMDASVDPFGNVTDHMARKHKTLFGYPAVEEPVTRERPLGVEDFENMINEDVYNVIAGTWISEQIIGVPNGVIQIEEQDKEVPYYILKDGTYALCWYKMKVKHPGDLEKIEMRNLNGEILQVINPTVTTSPRPGDNITFGSYKGEPIEWRVLEVKDNAMYLLSEKILDTKPYHHKMDLKLWDNSDLRGWLNKEFYEEAFTFEERERILVTDLINKGDGKLESGDESVDLYYEGENTRDRVFLLSNVESMLYLNSVYLPDYSQNKLVNKLGQAQGAQYAIEQGLELSDENNGNSKWWLRSPGYNYNACTYVDEWGNIKTDREDIQTIGVRPAIRIKVDNK